MLIHSNTTNKSKLAKRGGRGLKHESTIFGVHESLETVLNRYGMFGLFWGLLSLYLLYLGFLLPTIGENMATEFTLVVPGTPDHSKGRTGTPNHSQDKPKHINS